MLQEKGKAGRPRIFFFTKQGATCRICKQTKPLEDFYWDKYYQRPMYLCRPCEIKRASLPTPERRLTLRKASKKAQKKFAEKWATRSKTRQLVNKGVLKKLPCEVCGEEKVQAHHHDYSDPMRVTWFCSKHHAEHHQKLKANSNLLF